MARARTHTMPERPSQETLENVQMAGLHTLSLKCFTPVRGSHTRRPHSVEPETSMVAVSLTASEYTCKEGHRVQPAVSDLVDTAPLAFTLPESATPTSLIPPDGVASSQRAEVYQPYCTGGPVKRSNSIICRIAGVASQSEPNTQDKYGKERTDSLCPLASIGGWLCKSIRAKHVNLLA
eukprot:3871295-Pyramimonas_sp.AAC.2